MTQTQPLRSQTARPVPIRPAPSRDQITTPTPKTEAVPERRQLSLNQLFNLPGVATGATLIGTVLLWELVARAFAIPSYLLPAPSAILNSFAAIGFERWLTHIWSTLRVAILGFGLAIAVSVPLAMVMMRSAILSKTLYPLLVIVQSTPVVAIAPIIIVALGAGDLPRIVITTLITFFPLVVSTATGLAATPPELIELSRSLRAPAWREMTQIRLPYAVPYIFSALKISITLAVIGAVVAEFVAAEAGVGYFIQFSTSMFKLPQAWAGLIVLAAMSLTLFQAVLLVQKRLFPWSLPKSNN
ncbi:ABC transporter permease [Paracoccus aestuariivivens]|uniref:ABC transporter permease subunit n=1 Tax=Paracoccus aestuariivivens TaxID=1820333 RepID=A0A6L6J6U8_9RHOB|nr:ABC transporter permease [Paracoccus aestuariivivens]MTH76885.1 ABC transporter permease subunit [Paracoccus aestuariivivens]